MPVYSGIDQNIKSVEKIPKKLAASELRDINYKVVTLAISSGGLLLLTAAATGWLKVGLGAVGFGIAAVMGYTSFSRMRYLEDKYELVPKFQRNK